MSRGRHFVEYPEKTRPADSRGRAPTRHMSRDREAAVSLEPGAQSLRRPQGAAGELIPCSTCKIP